MSTIFLSTLPARGATAGVEQRLLDGSLFLSTLPARGATPCHRDHLRLPDISIHAPREGSDQAPWHPDKPRDNISIHAPREGSDGPGRIRRVPGGISIHAPREGSDRAAAAAGCCTHPISIHAPREGSDWIIVAYLTLPKGFLSTLPARGATVHFLAFSSSRRHFYPRSPRGERLDANALHYRMGVFLSTLPARGATALFFR